MPETENVPIQNNPVENTQTKNNLQQSIDRLEETVARLDKRIQTQNSYVRNFGLSLARGLASAVGATIIFGLSIAIVIQILRSIDYVPIINNILDSQAIENVISRFKLF